MSADIHLPQVNSVLRRVDDDRGRHYERLLWITGDGERACLIDVLDPFGMPWFVEVAELRRDLATGTLQAVADHASLDGEDRAALSSAIFCPPRLPSPDEGASRTGRTDRFEARRRAVERAWNAIAPILEYGPAIYFSPRDRGRLVREAAEKARVTLKTIYRWLRVYWQRGQTMYALVPAYERRGAGASHIVRKKRGRPSRLSGVEPEKVGVNVIGDVARDMLRGIQKYYLSGRMTLGNAYQATLEDFFSDDDWSEGYPVPVPWDADRCPTPGQFAYWARKLKFGDIEQSLRKMLGDGKYGRRFRPLMGRTLHGVSAPGQLYLGDGMVIPIHLVNALNPRYLNRKPDVYAWMDALSGRWVGFFLSFENASYHVAKLALHHAASDKAEFLGRYGIAADAWGISLMPGALHVDNGEFQTKEKEYLSLKATFRLKLEQDPPYRPDLKGLIERAIGILKNMLAHRLKGSERARFREKDAPDERLDAIFTLDEFAEALTRAMLHLNKYRRVDLKHLDAQMIADGVQPFPDDIWNWGIRNRPQFLPLRRSPEELALHLLPGGRARITPQGLLFKGVYYRTKRGDDEQWWGRAREREQRRGNKGEPMYVDIAFDPWRVERVFLRMEGQNTIEPCHPVDHQSAFIGRNFSDYEAWYEEQLLRDKASQHVGRRGLAALNAAIRHNEVFAQERADVHRAGLPKVELTRVDHDLQIAERDARRQEDALSNKLLPRESQAPAREDSSTSAPAGTGGNRYVGAPSFLDILRRARGDGS